MTKKIGLTGGIGSGKSTIAQFFQSKGIPVYIADIEAKKIMQDSSILEAIKNIFGHSVFENNELNRQSLALIVFNDPEMLKKLNKIVHPALKSHFDTWFIKQRNEKFIIYESAILFETGSYKNFDAIITVTAPIETRIARVIKRDNTTAALVLKRIEAQWTDEERIKKSDYVIDNFEMEFTLLKTNDIIKKLLNIQ